MRIEGRKLSHKVFISCPSSDRGVAEAACSTLEQAGITCWMAPRDIVYGMPYAEAVVEAISRSALLVLVFSASANSSPQVMREVERAVSRDIPILVYRIEDVAPTGSLEFFISSSHWLDAFGGPPAQQLHRLAEAAAKLLLRVPVASTARRSDPSSVCALPEVEFLKLMCWEGHWRTYDLNRVDVTQTADSIAITNTASGHYHAKVIYDRVLAGDFRVEIQLRGSYIDLQLQIASGQDKNFYVNPAASGIDIQKRQRFVIRRVGEEISFGISGASPLAHASHGALPLMSCYAAVAMGFGATAVIHGWSVNVEGVG